MKLSNVRMVTTALYSMTIKCYVLFEELWTGVGTRMLFPGRCIPDAPANLLYKLNVHVVPCTSHLCDKWVEDNR